MLRLIITSVCLAYPLACQDANFQSSNKPRSMPDPIHCDAHNFLKQYPPMMVEPSEAPAGARPHQSTTLPWTEIRIIYYIIPSTSSRTGAMLREAFDEVNKKLRPILKVQGQAEPRMAAREKHSTYCNFPFVYRAIRLAGEHHKPCYLNNGTYIPEPGISLNTSQENRLLDEEHLGLIIYVNANPNAVACVGKTDTAASTGPQMYYGTTGFPCLGVINFCLDPVDLAKAEGRLYRTLLHETIHILTFNSFIANQEYVLGRNPQEVAEFVLNKARVNGTRWRKIPRSKQNMDPEPEVIMTPAVLQATREYFKCTSGNLFGAELSKTVDITRDGERISGSDDSHWNDRLFPDEIMGSTYKEGGVLSKLTLAVLKETEWYQVDMSKAEPMMFDATERNIDGDGCDIALRDCGDILDDAKVKLQSAPYKLPWVGPFCSQWGNVPTRACSPDGRFRLQCSCGNVRAALSECCVYIKNSSMDGDPIDCLKNNPQTLPPGLYKSNKTGITCITFQNFHNQVTKDNAVVNIAKTNYPRCMVVTCLREHTSVWLTLSYVRIQDRNKTIHISSCDTGHICPKITTQEPCLPDGKVLVDEDPTPPFVKNVTRQSRQCQRWRSNTPHSSYYRGLPDDNICRNKGAYSQGPWCYTMDPNMRYEACFHLCRSNPVVLDWIWCSVFQNSKFICPDYVQTCEGSRPLKPLTVRPSTNLIVVNTTETSGCDAPKIADCMILLIVVCFIMQ